MTVHQLSHQLSNDELVEWMAYDNIDPFGGYRLDIQTAQILQVMYKNKDTPLKDYLIIDPNPIPPEIAERREYEAERERLRQETQAMQKMLFDEN